MTVPTITLKPNRKMVLNNTANARNTDPTVTKNGKAADIHRYLDENKIEAEAQYDGLYAVCTDLLDDDVSNILKVSEGRWQIE